LEAANLTGASATVSGAIIRPIPIPIPIPVAIPVAIPIAIPTVTSACAIALFAHQHKDGGRAQ